jgi:lipoate-protein ligase B
MDHPPTYTIGPDRALADLGVDPGRLRASMISAYAVDFPEGIRYVGPGHVVGYPIVHLAGEPLDEFRWAIEEGLIAAALQYGIGSRRHDDRPGVWVTRPDWTETMLAQVDLRREGDCTGGVFSLFVAGDPTAFELCHFDHTVTSFHALALPAPARPAATVVGETIAAALGGAVQWCELEARLSEVTSLNEPRDLLALPRSS